MVIWVQWSSICAAARACHVCARAMRPARNAAEASSVQSATISCQYRLNQSNVTAARTHAAAAVSFDGYGWPFPSPSECGESMCHTAHSIHFSIGYIFRLRNGYLYVFFSCTALSALRGFGRASKAIYLRGRLKGQTASAQSGYRCVPAHPPNNTSVHICKFGKLNETSAFWKSRLMKNMRSRFNPVVVIIIIALTRRNSRRLMPTKTRIPDSLMQCTWATFEDKLVKPGKFSNENE